MSENYSEDLYNSPSDYFNSDSFQSACKASSRSEYLTSLWEQNYMTRSRLSVVKMNQNVVTGTLFLFTVITFFL